MTLPPGRARLATKPAPTGSADLANTIGHGAGRRSSATAVALPVARDDVGRERDQFGRVSADVVGIRRGPALRSARCGRRPAQLLQALQECREAGLSLGIVRSEA